MKRYRNRWVAKLLALALIAFMIPQSGCGGGGGRMPSTDEVLNRLSTAADQASMEEAIRQLLRKTGLGVDTGGSSYTRLSVTNAEISTWARLQLSMTDPAAWPTVRGLHDSIEPRLEDPFISEFDVILVELNRQARGAFAVTPEEPDSALLIAMLSGPPLRATAPIVTGDTRLNPVQSILCAAWLVRQFSAPTRAVSRDSYSTCLKWCFVKYGWDVAKCTTAGFLKIAGLLAAAGLTIASLPATWEALLALMAAAGIATSIIDQVQDAWNDMYTCLDDASYRSVTCGIDCHKQGEVTIAPGQAEGECCR
jgi:hypothetical protein